METACHLDPTVIMRVEEIQSACERLDESIRPYDRLFGRAGARASTRTYLKGLMSPLERKSIEPIATAFGEGRISSLQKFINLAPWSASAVFRELQHALSDVARRRQPGVMVVDVCEHTFPKRGQHSVGVARQWDRTAKVRRKVNCQIGVFLVGSVPGVSCLLDARLHLPESWCEYSDEARRRRAQTRAPNGIHFRTRPQMALDLIHRCLLTEPVRPDWVVAGVAFGSDGDFLDGLGQFGIPYLVGVTGSEMVLPEETPELASSPWLSRPRSLLTVGELGEGVPAVAWRHSARVVRGRLVHEEYAVLRVRAPRVAMHARPLFLVISRALGTGDEVPLFYLSNATYGTPLETLAAALTGINSGADLLAEAEEFLGLDHYEVRSWVGWHHHMSLVALAHWFVTTAGTGAIGDLGHNSVADTETAWQPRI